MATDNETSPHQLGSLNFLADSHARTSRKAIKADLAGKILYDSPKVFSHLRLGDVDDQFVEMCAESLKTHNKEDIARLKELVERASNKSLNVLEALENADKASDTNKAAQSGNHGTQEEKAMYESLVHLFNGITQFGSPTGLREFHKTNGMLKADEPHMFGFLSASPDIMISPTGVNTQNSKKWRHCDTFGEVKPLKKQGPKPTTPGMIPPIVTQCANYARLFMSARPFMLFCVGILIFGTEFCVGIFDRNGITFSPIYDMFKATDTLVHVVCSLACELTMEELGFDPTVQLLDDEDTMKLTNQTGRNIYPSAMVSCGERQWCTIGSPIWASLLLLDCGTNVWRVKECIVGNDQHLHLTGDVMIMKTAWRSSAWTPKSVIYSSIAEPYPQGLAKYECRGDVQFPLTRVPITVFNLRSKVCQNLSQNTPATPVLHRLIFRTVGRLMWEYKSDFDLLTGFCDAIQAHKELCDKGILHRNISTGNVLLTEKPESGFITDLEFARMQNPTIRVPELTTVADFSLPSPLSTGGYRIPMEATRRKHTMFESAVTVKRGAGITGTAQFMAQAILVADDAKNRLMHEATHDIESFIWVLSYCIMCNLQIQARASNSITPDKSKAFIGLFKEAFGQATIRKIATERQSGSTALLFPDSQTVSNIIASFMSGVLVTLFKEFRKLIYGVSNPVNPANLTHEDLLEVINKAITSLE